MSLDAMVSLQVNPRVGCKLFRLINSKIYVNLTCSKVEKLCADLVRTRLPSQAISLAVRVGVKRE